MDQPDLRLPIELMVNIIEESLDLRRRSRGGRRDDPPRRYLPRSTQKNAVESLIRSCKLFASIIIPILYRDVILRQQYSIEAFLQQARISSLWHIKTLYVDFFAVEDLLDRVGDGWYGSGFRTLAALQRRKRPRKTPRTVAAVYHNIRRATESMKRGIMEYTADREGSCRPRLEHLEVNGDIERYLFKNLLEMSVRLVFPNMLYMHD
jgi:hypothetical protein